MKYSVNIEVVSSEGQKTVISRDVNILYDSDRNLYMSKTLMDVWTYGETPEELAIRLASEGWRDSRLFA